MGQLEATTRPRSRAAQPPEERARHEAMRERFRGGPASLDEILGADRSDDSTTLGTYRDMIRVLDELKEAREASGLTLADVSARCGMDPSAISRLENGHVANPTIGTIQRYASAIGKRLGWTIHDAAAC